MSEHPITRIVRHDTPLCETHGVYKVFDLAQQPRTWVCPVCRQESERDEGMDLFGAKPETTHG